MFWGKNIRTLTIRATSARSHFRLLVRRRDRSMESQRRHHGQFQRCQWQRVHLGLQRWRVVEVEHDNHLYRRNEHRQCFLERYAHALTNALGQSPQLGLSRSLLR
jgi:hypothetical protein